MEYTNREEFPLIQQLQWLLFLRVVFYTLMLGISFLFSASNLEIIVLPSDYLLIFILFIYTITVTSAIILKSLHADFGRFGLTQTLLDTIFVSVMVYYTGASHSAFTIMYFFPIISGGLLLPKIGGFSAAAAATIQYSLILALEYFDIVPSFLMQYQYLFNHDLKITLNHVSFKGISFFLAALLSALFSSRLAKTEHALTITQQSFEKLNILYKLVFDNISTGIITIDEKERITSINEALEKITGYKATELYLNEIQDIFPTLFFQVENERNAVDLMRKDGSITRVGYSFVSFYPDKSTARKNRKKHKIVTLQDISEIERLEKKYRQTEKLAAIGMMSASIAHDFRNPITAISGSAQVLAKEYLKGGDSDTRINYDLANIILRESNRLSETITNFLRFARPEETSLEWFSLKSCIDEVLQTFKASLKFPKTLDMIVQFPENLTIWGDRKQLTVVFNELIQNALAFCPKGSEIIKIEAQEKVDGEENFAVIHFSDNGKGINEDDKALIFEPFYTSRADGTGLGLAIINQTVENHHGEVEISKSELGGIRFTLILPLP